MDIKKTSHAIRFLKIQGAENITAAALKSLETTIRNSKAKTKQELLQELEHAIAILFKTRPTEPEMRNYCNEILFFLHEFPEKDLKHAKHAVKENIKHALVKKEERKERLTRIGELFLTNERKEKNLQIYTHCHSSTVIAILQKANKRKKISILNTETRPLFQGRKTAAELARLDIPVHHYVDAAMIKAIQQADLILIGADAITSEGAYNKIGSELLALLAKHFHKPLYICASLYKYDPHKEKIEQREGKEIWEHAPQGVTVHNPAYEKIHFKHIKRIICEQGVVKPKRFLKLAKKHIKIQTYLYP